MNPITLTNSSGKTLVLEEHKIKKGLGKGVYLAPNFTTTNLGAILEFYGEKKIWEDIVIPKLKQQYNGITKEAVSENGSDVQKIEREIQRMATELSQRGESMKALVQRKNELNEELASYMDKLKDGTGDTATFTAIAMSIAEINKTIAEKKAKDEEEAEEAEEAKTEAVAA